MNHSNAEKTSLRLPNDVTTWLREKAAHNVSSMTTEAVRAIRSQIARESRERATGASSAR
jgi:hypothetical protein